MVFLAFGLLTTVAAVGLTIFAVTAAPVDRLPLERRRFSEVDHKPVLTMTSDYLVSLVDRALHNHDWVPFRAREIELAGLTVTPGSLVVTVTSLAAATFLGITAAGSWIAGLILAALVPVIAKVVLRIRTSRRRKDFVDQLDETIQMIAAALRAGHSFPQAVDAVSRDAESPTAEEFARVVNENRLGRDLIVALEQTAERMESEDFHWVAEAVAVHRDTGGNLNEVLDRVGQTMRERNQIRRQVDSLAAEGKFSAIILMALPVAVGGFYCLLNPAYMMPMFMSPTGRMLLGGSLLLYIVGGFWMRSIVNVKF